MNGLFFAFLRQSLDSCRGLSTDKLRKGIFELVKDMLIQFRKNEVIEDNHQCYNEMHTNKELTVPRKIEHMLPLLHSLFREPVNGLFLR
jgi:hypothetical protein